MNFAAKDKSQDPSGIAAYRRVGCVLKPHGVDGSFLLFLESDFPKWVASQGVLFAQTDAGFQPWKVLHARRHKDTLILKVDVLENRTQTQEARGTPLFVPEEEALKANTDPDFFFNSDLVGLAVIGSESSIDYGEIIEVVPSPGQDLLQVKPKSGAPFLFPFSNALVTSIDIANKRITVIMPEGLLDLN